LVGWCGGALALEGDVIFASDGFESGDASGGTGSWTGAWTYEGVGVSPYTYEGAHSWWLGENAAGNFLQRQVDASSYIGLRLRYCVEAWGMEGADSTVLMVNGEVLQSFSGNWGDYHCFEHQLPSDDLLTLRFETSVDSAWEGIFVDNVEFIGVPYAAVELIAWDGFESGGDSGGIGAWTSAWTYDGLGLSPYTYEGAHSWWLGENAPGNYLARQVDGRGYDSVWLRYCVEAFGMEEGLDSTVLKVNGEVLQSFSGHWSDYECYEHQVPSKLLTLRFETSVNAAWEGVFVDNVQLVGVPGAAIKPSLARDGFERGDSSSGTGAWLGKWWDRQWSTYPSSHGSRDSSLEGAKAWWVGGPGVDFFSRAANTAGYKDVTLSYCVWPRGMEGDDEVVLSVSGHELDRFTGNAAAYTCHTKPIDPQHTRSSVLNVRFRSDTDDASEGVFIDNVEINGTPDPTAPLGRETLAWDGFETGGLSGGTGAWEGSWTASATEPSSNAYEGMYAWHIGEAAGEYLERTVDATDYTDVRIQYCVQAMADEDEETFNVFVNGRRIHDLADFNLGGYRCFSAAVPSGRVTLRFEAASGESIDVDAVEVSGIYQPPYSGAGLVPPTTKPLRARVMSFNLRWGEVEERNRLNNWEHRRDGVYRVLEDFAPDLVGTQESARYQINDIEARFDGDPELPSGDELDLDSYQYSTYLEQILYNSEALTLLGSGGFLLHEGVYGMDAIPFATWVHVQDNDTGRAYYHYNVHLHAYNSYLAMNTSQLSAVRLMEHIAARPTNDPFVVTGDFNSHEDSATIKFLRGEQQLLGYSNPLPLVDTYRVLHAGAGDSGTVHHFRGEKDGRKIDYVFVEKSTLDDGLLTVESAEIVHTEVDGRYPSDHFPVTAVIVWR
jgi:endonuclease/exonuclease/phosphatase family metal-dependent hydrolase